MITSRPTPTRFSARDLSAPWRHVDGVLLAAVVVVGAMGAGLVHSATRTSDGGAALFARHLLFLLVGVGVMAAVSLVDYRRILDWWPVLYGSSLVMLVGVLSPLGSTVNATSRWYRIGPVSVQPAEFVKLTTILAVAAYLGSADRVDLRRLTTALAMFGAPIAIIMLQPDLGTALVFIAIGAGMLVVGGARLVHLATLGVLAVGAVVLALSSGMLDDYQQERLTSFVTPDGQSYNVTQAQTAISSGGLTGYGWGQGPQTRGGFVPVQESDFIFTVAGEEFGFLGSGLLVALLGVIVWRVWRAAQLARDQAGTLLCVGVMCMLLFHVFENVGMTLGIMPVTGLPLPFVSHGGTSILASFAAVGLVQSVHMHRFN